MIAWFYCPNNFFAQSNVFSWFLKLHQDTKLRGGSPYGYLKISYWDILQEIMKNEWFLWGWGGPVLKGSLAMLTKISCKQRNQEALSIRTCIQRCSIMCSFPGQRVLASSNCSTCQVNVPPVCQQPHKKNTNKVKFTSNLCQLIMRTPNLTSHL